MEYLLHTESGDQILCHQRNFKYIYKRKINGKWRYYYENPKPDHARYGDGRKIVKNHLPDQQSKNDYSRMDILMGKPEKDRLEQLNSQLVTAEKNRDIAKRDYDRLESKTGNGGIMFTQYMKKSSEVNAIVSERSTAIDRYRKTPLYKVSKAKEEFGRTIVGSMLSTAVSKLKKKR